MAPSVGSPPSISQGGVGAWLTPSVQVRQQPSSDRVRKTAPKVMDPLETLNATADFERFRPILERAAGSPRGQRGGRPSLDVVLKAFLGNLESWGIPGRRSL